jgi:hypothetical protein
MSSSPASESKIEVAASSKTAATDETNSPAAKIRPIFAAPEGKATFVGDIVQSELPREEWDRMADESWARATGEALP